MITITSNNLAVSINININIDNSFSLDTGIDPSLLKYSVFSKESSSIGDMLLFLLYQPKALSMSLAVSTLTFESLGFLGW
jgi:hypothetical protein